MSALTDENAVAAVRAGGDNITDLLSHFQREATWSTFGPGQNEAWLEQVKMDLTMLATVIESRIQEISPPVVQEFGT